MSTPLARTTDPDTSHTAAHAVETSTTRQAIIAEILQVLRRHGPLATFQMAEKLPHRDHDQIWKRASDLKTDRRIRDTGDRILGPKGRPVMILELEDA